MSVFSNYSIITENGLETFSEFTFNDINNYFDSIKLSTDNLYLYEAHLEALDESVISDIFTNIGKGIAKVWQAIVNAAIKLKDIIVNFVKNNNTYIALRRKDIINNYNKFQVIDDVYDFKDLFAIYNKLFPLMTNDNIRENMLTDQLTAIFHEEFYDHDWMMQKMFEPNLSINNVKSFDEFKQYFRDRLRNTDNDIKRDIQLKDIGTAEDIINNCLSADNVVKILKGMQIKFKFQEKSITKELSIYPDADPVKGNEAVKFGQVYSSYIFMYATEFLNAFKEYVVQSKYIVNQLLDHSTVLKEVKPSTSKKSLSEY